MTAPHPTAPLDSLHQQRLALDQLRLGGLSTQTYLLQARAVSDLLAGLPPRYAEVWHGLLDRLESAALFTEESCSFSQGGLLANLQLWLDKAQGLLASAPPHQREL
ncbi:MAG: hypothetical protein RJA09_2199 [Pseudomonadota bacterium]|jgi:hypothetical protein